MDLNATRKYYTKTTELKETIIEYILKTMKEGSEKDKKELAIACIKSRLFDESTTIKTDVVNYTISEHGEAPKIETNGTQSIPTE